jgi:hypothetical protein
MSFRYETQAELWLWNGGSWHFLTLPEDVSAGLKSLRGSPRGFGSMRVEATIGKTSWRTSVFPTKQGEFLLPVKADVRKKEGLSAGEQVTVAIEVLI